MKIIMIKKKGCNPCKMFEPTIKNVAKQNHLEYKAVQAEDMPEKMRPEIFPYFYLLNGEDLLENWAGTSTRKMYNVLKRHIPNFSFNE
jgi:thiol-disulfide isomerase/thioredoxin